MKVHNVIPWVLGREAPEQFRTVWVSGLALSVKFLDLEMKTFNLASTVVATVVLIITYLRHNMHSHLFMILFWFPCHTMTCCILAQPPTFEKLYLERYPIPLHHEQSWGRLSLQNVLITQVHLVDSPVSPSCHLSPWACEPLSLFSLFSPPRPVFLTVLYPDWFQSWIQIHPMQLPDWECCHSHLCSSWSLPKDSRGDILFMLY